MDRQIDDHHSSLISMTDASPRDPPSPFVAAWIARLAEPRGTVRRALDIATGRGRHLRLLAEAGFRAFGVDSSLDVLVDTRRRLGAADLECALWCADLTVSPLPAGRFDLIVVTRYLQRDLFPRLPEALAPGGAILYETFTEAQRKHARGPRAAEHLLRPGELRRAMTGLEELFYEEVDEPDAVARLAARASTRRS